MPWHKSIAPFLRGHPGSFEFARRLAELTPGDLNRIFFANSGSEAVDTAMKVTLACHQARSQGGRTMFVSRERAYHGVNFGGLALSGLVNNRRRFALTLPGRRGHAFQKRLFDHGLHLKTTGDAAIIAPPLIATRDHVDEIAAILRRTLAAL